MAGRKMSLVVILAGAMLVGLSGVLVPQFFLLEAEAKEAALVTDLQAIREALARFQREHRADVRLGSSSDGVSEVYFVRQLICKTLADGTVDSGGTLGPYLPAGMPPNPFNGLNSVRVITESELPPPDGSTGWLYHPASGTFRANSPGMAPSGPPLSSL